MPDKFLKAPELKSKYEEYHAAALFAKKHWDLLDHDLSNVTKPLEALGDRN